MSKILILANFDVGLYKFRKELIQEFIKQGNEVYISLPYGELVGPLVEMGCHFIDTKVDRRGINPLIDVKLIISYIKIMKRIKPDMVITYTIKPNVYGGSVCRLLKIPYAINITGLGTAFQSENFVKKLVCLLYRHACKRAKVVFFENKGNANAFQDNRLVRMDQICCLNGAGVNLEEYTYTEYPTEDGTIRFLFVGRVMKEKGVDELFEVARRIRKEHKNVFFDIVGPYEEDYKEIVERLVEDKVIVYHGFQKDVRPFIARCHCFVLPSYHEGMANTLLEAGAMGRPLITSRIHGCMEAVVEGESGFLGEVKSIKSLENVMFRFIQVSYLKKCEMARQSRIHIEEKFDKKKVVNWTCREVRSWMNQ